MVANINFVPEDVVGLDPSEFDNLHKLLDVYQYHLSKNEEKNKYYEGNIRVSDVNLGIALPKTMRNLEIGCSWGAKTVDVLASRSMFDGFVGLNGSDVSELTNITLNNNLIAEYSKACRDELKYGCTFATLSADTKIGCKIRFHSPQTAAALWDGEKGRIKCGFAIIDTVQDEVDQNMWHPIHINYYTDNASWSFEYIDGKWIATKWKNQMGRPMMEALIWNATSNKPFGRSRIKEPIRNLIDGYVRTLVNATIGLEFATSPQKYLLGVSDDQYDAIVNDKFKQYVGSIIAATNNPETGEKPTFGQLQQGTINPHVEMIRLLATQFSAATGLSVTDTGIINDANPTSSDAILAQSQTLIAMAESLNKGNGYALRIIANMALAISRNVPLDSLTEEDSDVIAHFKNPAMPSVAVTTDAAIKIASAREGFANTDVFLEMIGFDQAQIRRIKSEEQKTRGLQLLEEITEEEVEAPEEEVTEDADIIG